MIPGMMPARRPRRKVQEAYFRRAAAEAIGEETWILRGRQFPAARLSGSQGQTATEATEARSCGWLGRSLLASPPPHEPFRVQLRVVKI